MTNLLITVEHASNRLPAEAHGLGLAPKILDSHVAWDPGALALGRALHVQLGGELLIGEWSRLWVDLNRSETNPRVAPPKSFGVHVPGNVGLGREALRRRIEDCWCPFREQARRIVEASGHWVHIGMHTFTPDLGGESRDFDLAALYDPRRPWERELAGRIVTYWRAQGWKARRNAPYRGVTDAPDAISRRALRRPGDRSQSAESWGLGPRHNRGRRGNCAGA